MKRFNKLMVLKFTCREWLMCSLKNNARLVQKSIFIDLVSLCFGNIYDYIVYSIIYFEIQLLNDHLSHLSDFLMS